MKRPDSIGFYLECATAVAMVCLCAAPALADAPATAAKKPALAATAKKAASRPTAAPVSGPGSLTGLWTNLGFKDYKTGPPVGVEAGDGTGPRTADGQPVPMLPWAAAVVAERRKLGPNGEPYAGNSSQCLTDGMPAATSTPNEQPLQIIETPEQGQITVLYQYFNIFRQIHMNQQHPHDPDPTFMGHEVGHWEGDTLVIDTIGITTHTSIRGNIPHSEDLHVVERIRHTNKDMLEDLVTIDDPKTFTKPWTFITRLKRAPAYIKKLDEWVCENNRNVADASGHYGVQLQGQ